MHHYEEMRCADASARFDCPNLDCPDRSGASECPKDGALERELVDGVLETTASELMSTLATDEIAFTLTNEGEAALQSYATKHECDLCRRTLSESDPFFTATIGMDEEPSRLSAPLDAGILVEETSDLVFCAGCHPAAKGLFDTLLRSLWDLRKADPAEAVEAAP